MKIFIIIISLFTLLITSVPFTVDAFEWNVPWKKDKQSKIEKNEEGGYSETQRDYKARKRRSEKSKQGEGYNKNERTYKSKSNKYKKHEWQFIDED